MRVKEEAISFCVEFLSILYIYKNAQNILSLIMVLPDKTLVPVLFSDQLNGKWTLPKISGYSVYMVRV